MDIGYHDIGHVIHEIYTSSSLCVLILWYIIASPDSTLARTSQCIPTVCSTCAKSTSPLLLFPMDLLTMGLDPQTHRSIHLVEISSTMDSMESHGWVGLVDVHSTPLGSGGVISL